MANPGSFTHRMKSLVVVSLGGIGFFAGFNIFNSNEKFYKDFVVPMLHKFDPETAHKVAIFVAKYYMVPKSTFQDDNTLKIKAFGKEFPNPVGLAAGFDKDGEAVIGLRKMGFGFIEVGSVTPWPQPGNNRPRLFRLNPDLAIINRYGFNSAGQDEVYKNLECARNSDKQVGIVGVNLGKNKASRNAINDYVTGIKKFGPVADYLVINVSSPNTPGLRDLQNKEDLKELLKKTVEARNQLPENERPPLLLKISPDLTGQQLKDIANVIKSRECHVDGLIICNTTLERPPLKDRRHRKEAGGLSGLPLKDKSTKMIAQMYKLTNGIDIIGVGGVFNGKDAYEKIRAGAKVVQIYTSLIFEGPLVVGKIKRELEELLLADGFQHVAEAVGIDAHAMNTES